MGGASLQQEVGCGIMGCPIYGGCCMEPERDLILNLEGAAARIGVSPRTLRSLVREGKIPQIRLSPRRRGYSTADLVAYLERGRIVQNSPPATSG